MFLECYDLQVISDDINKRSVQKVSNLWAKNTQHNEYHKFYLISFKILPLQVHTLFPAPLPLLETPLKLLLWNVTELRHCFFHNVVT